MSLNLVRTSTALRVRNVDTTTRRVNIREAVAEVNVKAVLGSVNSHEKRAVEYPDFLDAAVTAACTGKGQEDRLWNSEEGRLPAARQRRFGLVRCSC